MLTIFLQFFAAMIATISFSILFSVPRRYYVGCGIIGAAGWVVYFVLVDFSSDFIATLAAAITVVFLSRLAAVLQHCPATLFLVSGIIPLVPGAGVYWTSYYFITNELGLAIENGYQALKIAFAIVLGIVLVFELPQTLFVTLCGRKKSDSRQSNDD